MSATFWSLLWKFYGKQDILEFEGRRTVLKIPIFPGGLTVPFFAAASSGGYSLLCQLDQKLVNCFDISQGVIFVRSAAQIL